MQAGRAAKVPEEMPPPPPVDEITPALIVIVLPSGFTAPKAPVVASGNVEAGMLFAPVICAPGKPVAFVRTRAEGVPSAGVTSVGEMERTTFPVPVADIPPNTPELLNWICPFVPPGLPAPPPPFEVLALTHPPEMQVK